MKKVALLYACGMLILALMGAPVFAADERPAPAAGKPTGKDQAPEVGMSVMVRAPLFSARFADVPLALVNDEPITVKELSRAMSSVHGKQMEERAAGKQKYGAVLDRLITIRLVAQEARNMGLIDLPEVKETIDANAQQFLIQMLMDKATAQVKPDEAEVEASYRDSVREYKATSVLFGKEDAARKAAEEIKNGKDFEETVKKFVESKDASSEPATYEKRENLLTEIAKAVTDMKVGATSPVIPIERGFVILKLEDVRMPPTEDTAMREQAQQESYKRQKRKAVMEFKQALLAKYVKLNRKLFEKLDYEAKESAFEKLLNDKREIAEIKGEKPLTVAELTAAINEKLYHGVKPAYENRTINEKKIPVLNELLGRRIEQKEIQGQGLDKTDEYKDALKEMENSVLFDMFIRKAIIPDIRPKEEDLKAYYESHQKEFIRPQMVKLASLAFKDKKNAETAIERLRKGADFNWMQLNAQGVVTDAESIAPATLPVLASSLPAELQKAIDGVKQGDYRFYKGPKGMYYAVFIVSLVPEQLKPFDEVSQLILKTVINEQLSKSLAEWTAKLKDAYPVKVYLTESDH